MEFEYFLNEKLADDLTPHQMDNYWKAIHAYNSWKKNKKNSMKIKNQLAYIYHEYPLDDRAKGKIRSLIDTIATYLETGEDTTTIKHREPKDQAPGNDKPAEYQIDTSDFNQIELTEDFLEEAFKKFNAKYFDNKLDPIPLEIDSSIEENGKFVYTINPSTKSFVKDRIVMNPVTGESFARFRNTLVHEMLHYYVHIYNPLPDEVWNQAIFNFFRGKRRKALSLLESTPATCHGGLWLKLAKELNKKYKELAITRNTFLDFRANKDKLSLIEQLKDAYILDYYFKSWRGNTKHNAMIVSGDDFRLLMDLVKDHDIKLTQENYHQLEDTFWKYHIEIYNGSTGFLKYSKIENPAAIASFPISDLNNGVFAMSDNMYKQMQHTKAFKMKEFGKIHCYEEPKTEKETKTESTEKDFKTWLNEKTSKKWDVNKLKALGLSDEEIADLLNGEADDEVVSIS